MAVWLALAVAVASPQVPAHLTCDIGMGAHRVVFDLELDEQHAQAAMTVNGERARIGSIVFGARFITIVRLIGRETQETTISRTDYSARLTGSTFDEVQFGSCKSAA